MLARFRKRIKGGFTLIELMIVVAIIGVLAAVAIPAFMKYIRKSKTTEAVQGVKKIYEGARSYYMEESNARGSTSPIPKQFPTSATTQPGANTCCSAGSGGKCPPNPLLWTASWNALKFAMDDPHYYWYSYASGGTDLTSSFTARGLGNLDCDTVYATFEFVGSIQPDGSVTGSAGLFKNNEME